MKKQVEPTQPQPEWILVSEAAQIAGVKDTKTIRNWIEAGHITARRYPEGAPYQILRSSLVTYLDQKRGQTSKV